MVELDKGDQKPVEKITFNNYIVINDHFKTTGCVIKFLIITNPILPLYLIHAGLYVRYGLLVLLLNQFPSI